MKPEDVPDEWLYAADTVLVPGKPLNNSDLRRALAAVAPMIAAGEREACALVADDVCDPFGGDDGFSARAIAAAIRARATFPASTPPPPSE